MFCSENLEAYFYSKGIIKREKNYRQSTIATECSINDVLDYLKILTMFHAKVIGYSGSLPCSSGKEIEDYKDSIRKMKSIRKSIKMEDVKTDIDIYVLDQCEKYIYLGEKYVSSMYNSGFTEILERSIQRKEVCIGGKGNIPLRLIGNNIEVGDIESCSYDFLEMDAIRFFNKLRKKCQIDYPYAVNEYCSYEKLDEKSYNFIMDAIRFPYRIIHYIGKYADCINDKDKKNKFAFEIKKLISIEENNMKYLKNG